MIDFLKTKLDINIKFVSITIEISILRDHSNAIMFVESLSCRKTLEAFKEGEIDVLIGTDRMARGIHIDGLRYVINYDMPPYVKTYIHRAGRTARAGESGSCFTFLRKHEVMA